MSRSSTERGRLLRRLLKAMAVAFLAGTLASIVFWVVWEPRPETEERFDLGENGLWIGHKWFTGVTVRDEVPVTDEELEILAATVQAHGIRYLYHHVGPVLADGSIEDTPSDLPGRLMAATPDSFHLAWLGGLTTKLDLAEPPWVAGFLATAQRMVELGYDGVHLDFEPLNDDHPGYVDLLAALRDQLGADVMISHATRRSAPFGISIGPMDRYCWSAGFYRKTMALADQTVLMAYDTGLDKTEYYLAFIGHQTRLLVRWAADYPGHQVLIGIPSYEEGSPASDPRVENLANGALGVRRALEKEGTGNGAFTGVSIYANWVTDEGEWSDFRRHWMERDEE
jgi:hypothetical protein